MNQNQNPLTKVLLPELENNINEINIKYLPDFLHPDESSELFIYLTQRINWPYFSLLDIFEKQKQINNSIKYTDWENEINNKDKEIKQKIMLEINNKNSKLIIESVHNYMKFLNIYFYKQFGDKIRTFIFLEYFLKILENDTYIINSDEYCHLYKLYFNLCRDAENIFDYLEKKQILIKNELYYYERGCYYERLHLYNEANQTYIEGFINILDDSNKEIGRILKNNYINFENRMLNRIERDLQNLNEDWNAIDEYMHKMIKETKDNELKSKNVNINLNSKKKYFLKKEETNEKFLERKLIKNININFSIKQGKLDIDINNNTLSKGIEVISVYGNVKYIESPPEINKVTSITSIYELLKKILSTFFPEWKKEYDNFDLETKQNNEKLPLSFINEQRPISRNIKNLEDNNTVLNLIQNEYKDDNMNINNNKEEENPHEISNMLSNIGLILDKKDNSDLKPKNINQNNDNKVLLENIQHQIEKNYENKIENKKEKIIINNNKENKKNSKTKTNRFKCIGKLNFDENGLVIINLENEKDKKINELQSSSKNLSSNKDNKTQNKKYLITLENIPRRIKYLKEKTSEEKQNYDKRKKEMLEGVNFDYLNSFKKLFETYPQLNNLLESDNKIQNKNKNSEENKLNLNQKNKKEKKETSEAMKLLLKVYGIPQNFLEENNTFMEYAKKNQINIENNNIDEIFKDIQSYINSKNVNKKKINIYQNNNDNKENIDADGDLIIESDNEEENNKKSKKEEKEEITENIKNKSEKNIFSNYKGVGKDNDNKNKLNQNYQINKSIQISIKKEDNKEEKNEDELNKKKMLINNSKISANIFMSAFNYDLKNENKKNYTKKRKLTESSIKQDLSNSLAIEKNLENQFYSESNYSKKIKGKINTFLNKNEKNNELSNIKESIEKSSKIEKTGEKKTKNNLENIGNIHDLNNFDDLFK